MINKINYKLVNLAIFMFIIFLIYQTSGLWSIVLLKLFKIFFPFLIAFSVAYAFYPYSKKLQDKKIPKSISNFMVCSFVFIVFGFLILVVAPLLFEQVGSLLNGILLFIKDTQMKYDFDFGPLTNIIQDNFSKIIKDYGKGIISIVSKSFSYLSTIIITISASIYFLIDMDKIREKIKNHYKEKGIKKYNYIKALDDSMKNYLDGFTKIIIITIIEYTIAFLLIGHPNAILLGFLSAVANLIPYFGGLITNTIALITAIVISPKLFIRTLIVFLILSILDSYVINPFVYGKSNKLHPIIVILSVFGGGILFGILGIIISLPMTILLLTTYNYYKKDINKKINKLEL